jgi:hypothetical protein
MTYATEFPDMEITISSPAQLTKVLRQAKRCLADGTLRHIDSAESQFAVPDLAKVADEGPWPDYIEAHFEDDHGHQYKLAVETYHGAGGTWGRTNRCSS